MQVTPIATRHVSNMPSPGLPLTASFRFEPELDDERMSFRFVMRHKSPHLCLWLKIWAEEHLTTAHPLIKAGAHAEHFSGAMSKPASSARLSQRHSDRKIVKKEKIQSLALVVPVRTELLYQFDPLLRLLLQSAERRLEALQLLEQLRKLDLRRGGIRRPR